MRRAFLARLAPIWLRWARWCVEHKALFDVFAMHIDQVSLALAAKEMEINIEPLHRLYNMPTHFKVRPDADVDAKVLHYHWQLDSQLLLRPVGLPRVDTAIARVNQCLASLRRTTFLSSIFFGARFELFPEFGSGAGSQGENLRYKERLLRDLINDPNQSVLEIGCGDLAVSAGLPVTQYLGVDLAASGVQAAQRRRPDWDFLAGNATDLELAPRDVVVCLDVLIHQSTYAQYRKLVAKLCMLAGDTLIVGAYDCEPAFVSTITFYYEPISKTLEEYGEFTEISVVGKYRDIFVFVARKRRALPHGRDLAAREFNTMSLVTDQPLLLRLLVDEARAKIGFFPAHTPRALEYPWILGNLPSDLKGCTVLDVGAGVNPLPLMLAHRGATAVTVDGHMEVRDIANRSTWNEWGFLDYSVLDRRVTSHQSFYEDWTSKDRFAVIFSVSVIEHLPANVRRRWITKFAAQLQSGGLLLLTVDVVPETDRLWNFSAGIVVEPEGLHGTFDVLLNELREANFTIEERFIKRNIPGSRVDVGFMRARRSLLPSSISASLPRADGSTGHNVDWVNRVFQPYASNEVRAAAAQGLRVEGWAVDSLANAPASGVEIVVDGVAYEARYGLERRDVSEYFDRPAYIPSGFALDLPAALFAEGAHDLRIRVISAPRDSFWEGNALRIVCSRTDG